MAEIFEVFMLVLFGLSWPMNIIKSIRSKTAKGRSIFFMYLIILGYISGIIAKIVGNNVNYVIIFYIANLIMVCVDLVLCYVNKKRDGNAKQTD